MSNLMIEGGRRLSGSLPVYGAKNAILPILAACIIVNKMFKWWWVKLPLNRPAEGEL